MTNIEKVKRILDAGHWVKVTYEDCDDSTVTSYIEDAYSYIEGGVMYEGYMTEDIDEDCTIEVIQRIPTAYVAGDKVLVLSNPFFNEDIEAMVGNVCIVRDYHDAYYTVYADDKSKYYIFPYYCLAPAFDEPKEEPTLSGKEAKVVIDGKEYTCVIK